MGSILACVSDMMYLRHADVHRFNLHLLVYFNGFRICKPDLSLSPGLINMLRTASAALVLGSVTLTEDRQE